MTMSGRSPAISICAIASWPMTVWCRRTWLSTLPSEYFVSSRPAASSIASLIAMPRLPVESGSLARTARPAFVWFDGEGMTVAPNDSMKLRRYGFCS